MRPMRVPVLKRGVIIVVVVVQIVCGGFVLVPCFGVFLVSSLVQQFILQKGAQWPYIEAGVNMCGSRGGTGGPDPTWKITKIKGSLTILVRIPLKSQSYQSSIHCWAIIGPPAKRHLKGVSLTGR